MWLILLYVVDLWVVLVLVLIFSYETIEWKDNTVKELKCEVYITNILKF